METPERQHASISITGMGCPGSEAVVLERRLGRLPGVLEARVNGVTERAHLTLDPGRTTLDEIVDAIRKAGYETGSVAGRHETAGAAAAPGSETRGTP